jgi:hypothetical protein
MSIAKHLIVVFATVDPSVEAGLNQWYNEVHPPENRDCPGLLLGQRYVSIAGAESAGTWRSMKSTIARRLTAQCSARVSVGAVRRQGGMAIGPRDRREPQSGSGFEAMTGAPNISPLGAHRAKVTKPIPRPEYDETLADAR